MNSVYFARCGAYVKIGFSSWPEQRAKYIHHCDALQAPDDLDRMSRKPAELLRVIPNCLMKDERALHDLFAEFRAVGEWFHATDEFLRRVADLEYVTVREQRAMARRERARLKVAQLTPSP